MEDNKPALHDATGQSGRVALIIAAAGRGERMGADVRKPYLELAGAPILFRTLERFRLIESIQQRVLAVHPEDVDRVRTQWGEKLSGFYRVTKIVAGGNARTDTIWNALQALAAEPDQVILIHDGVRPFVHRSVILEVIKRARMTGAAIAAVPVIATVKRVDESGAITSTLDRNPLRLAQTPQGFRREVIIEAYEKAVRDGALATDDAAIVERTGRKVYTVADRYDNIKITTPEDMALAEAILSWQAGTTD